MSEPAVVEGEKKCSGCGCTSRHACEGGCSWASDNPPLCTRCAEKEAGTPVYAESIGGALIDSARISVMAAGSIIPPQSQLVLPGDSGAPNIHDCLEQAMQWLDAARAQTVERATTPPTSFHVVTR
jgi:hypothetical protein